MKLHIAFAVVSAAVVGFAAAPAGAQDAVAGEKVFRINCSPCHVTDRGVEKIGPSLFGVTGQGGPFDSMDELDHYLTNPRSVLPKTMMVFGGIKDAQQRKDLVAYLKKFE